MFGKHKLDRLHSEFETEKLCRANYSILMLAISLVFCLFPADAAETSKTSTMITLPQKSAKPQNSSSATVISGLKLPIWRADKPANGLRKIAQNEPSGSNKRDDKAATVPSDDKQAQSRSNDSANASPAQPVTPSAESARVEKGSAEATSDGSARKKKGKTEFLDCLPCMTWVDPDVEPKAVLVCVHGLGLHNDSYEDFGKRVCKLGYTVMAVDVPGFGSFKNTDDSRDRVDFDYCLRGIRDTLKLVRKVNPGLPVFVLGESMGGAIALRVTSEYPELVDGLISSVPSGDRGKQGNETLKVGLKLLTSPNKEFDIGTNIIKRATQNDELKEKWSGDPLNRMNLTPKELLRFQSFMNDNHESAKKITKTPVLFVQGCEDRLVRPEGTVQLFNALACEDRQIELIRDKEHLIFEEGQFDDQVIEIVDKWLTAHCGKNKQLTSK